MVQAVQAVPAVQRGLMIFSYEGIRLKESCWINGKPYFTRRAIGEFLEYPHPNKAIDNIIQRNPHISDPRWSTTLKLRAMQDTGKNDERATIYSREIEVEVFDPIGLQLIINKSNQPKAIAFQVAVAHLVYDYVTGNLRPFKWNSDITSALSQIISMPGGRKRKLMVLDLAKETGKSWNTIYRMAKQMNRENLKVKGNKPKKTRTDKGSFVHLLEFQQVKEYLNHHPGAKGREIKKATSISRSESTINCWLRSIRAHKQR